MLPATLGSAPRSARLDSAPRSARHRSRASLTRGGNGKEGGRTKREPNRTGQYRMMRRDEMSQPPRIGTTQDAAATVSLCVCLSRVSLEWFASLFLCCHLFFCFFFLVFFSLPSAISTIGIGRVTGSVQ